jgi:hypothetical protein
MAAVAWVAWVLLSTQWDLRTGWGTTVEVRVLSAPSPSGCLEKDYIRLHTDADPLDDTVVLATIERVTDRTKQDDCAATRVKILLARQRMSADAALVLATSYAERKQVAVVYADPAELSR